MKTTKMLVTTELDELSAKVARFAVNLSTQLGAAELVLLNVIVPVTNQTFSATGDSSISNTKDINLFNAALLKKHQALVTKEAEKLTTEKLKVRPIVRFSDSKTDLNGYMEYFNANVAVFGSRDEHSFLNKFFGIDSEEVVRKVDYPSIILKDETNYGDIKNILVAIDVNEDNQSGLNDIANFAKQLEAKMHLLHVLVDGEASSDEAIEKLNSLAKEFKLINYAINVVNNTNLEDGIKGYVRKNKVDMIAVQSQGKGKIKNLIFGSSTQDIIKENDKPVFVSKIT
ncbi:MAG: universal stress protein [Bacteroidales bacterium]|nr:universal stress protein [Bacteroidales bacterium]